MPFEVLYGAKLDVSNLRAFSTPCAIVEPTERLRKLDDRATMCFFLGYKYATGFGTQKRRVVVESRDLGFFEDGLLPPTLNDSRLQPTDEDESTVQPAPDHTTEPPTLPAAPDAPVPTLLFTASLEAMHDHGPTTTPHLRITIHLLGRCRTQRRIR